MKGEIHTFFEGKSLFSTQFGQYFGFNLSKAVPSTN
jgi:hypothetical protein